MKILKDERGISVTIITLLLVPLLLIGIFATANYSKTIQEYDVNLQVGLGEAVRNAAFMVDKNTLALGKPLINHEQAHKAFKKILDKRISKGEIENYIFVVYNGYDGEGKAYYYKNGELVNFDDSLTSLEKQTFYISPTDINTTTGEVTTSFNEPGCIALVELKTNSFFNNEIGTGLRWAASTIITSKDLF